MVDTLWMLLWGYLALSFAKFCLMVSNAHVAAAVHVRMVRRQANQELPWFRCYVTLLVTSVFIVLLSVPYALYKERWRFFRAYTRREVMRDILAEYRA